jgi:hypothetical protein
MIYRVELHKTFTDGNLIGLSVVDHVNFTTWEGATDFARFLQGKTVRTADLTSTYRVDFAFAEPVR